MVKNSVDSYLAAQKAKATPAAQAVFNRLDTLYAAKHWHQLTNELKTCLVDPAFTKGLNLMEFYKEFIADFEHRINTLSLIQLLLPVVDSVGPKDGVAFLTTFKEKLQKEASGGATKEAAEKEALVLVNANIALRKLHIKDERKKVADINDIRALVEETGKLVEELDGVTEVHGEFHKANAAYLCEVADHAGYYREALRYLGCIDEARLSKAERVLIAQRLCLSALLGKDVYNFGELLAHPLMGVLAAHSEEWLLDLVKAFNAGDLARFSALEPKWGKSFDIKSHKDELVAKLRLLAIMEMAFARSASEREIPFAELAKALVVPVDEVEVLVMRALSRGLVKGDIDQVTQTVHFTWVLPRVLDKALIEQMDRRINAWAKEVKATSAFIDDKAKDILIR